MRLPPWLWRLVRSRRLKRFVICAPFVLMIGVAAFYWIANWLGQRKFEKTVAGLKAEGFAVTIEDAFGRKCPAEDDMFSDPAMAAEMAADENQRLTSVRRMGFPEISQRSEAWKITPDLHRRIDVRRWIDPPPATTATEAEVATDLLLRIQPQSVRFDALAPALDRPSAAWAANRQQDPIDYSQLFSIQGIYEFAHDRAILHLAVGDHEAAAADLDSLLRLIIAASRQPCTVSLHDINRFQRGAFEVVWEGIERGAWTSTELAHVQSLIEAYDSEETSMRAMAGEIAIGSSFGQWALAHPDRFKAGYFLISWKDIGGSFWDAIRARDQVQAGRWLKYSWCRVRPLGSDLGDAADDLQFVRSSVLFSGNVRRKSLNAKECKHIQGLAWAWTTSPRATFVMAEVCEMTSWIPEITSRQSLIRCGLALERYRLKCGTYPDTLAVLVPDFLSAVPLDVCDGKPLRYNRLLDGSPHVWTLWPSGKDEGGLPSALAEKGNRVWITGELPGLTDTIWRRP